MEGKRLVQSLKLQRNQRKEAHERQQQTEVNSQRHKMQKAKLKVRTLTNRTTKLMEDAGEEHHGNSKKVEGRRHGEEENLQIETKNNVQEGLFR